jgi:hypothetical protein
MFSSAQNLLALRRLDAATSATSGRPTLGIAIIGLDCGHYRFSRSGGRPRRYWFATSAAVSLGAADYWFAPAER